MLRSKKLSPKWLPKKKDRNRIRISSSAAQPRLGSVEVHYDRHTNRRVDGAAGFRRLVPGALSAGREFSDSIDRKIGQSRLVVVLIVGPKLFIEPGTKAFFRLSSVSGPGL